MIKVEITGPDGSGRQTLAKSMAAWLSSQNIGYVLHEENGSIVVEGSAFEPGRIKDVQIRSGPPRVFESKYPKPIVQTAAFGDSHGQ